MNYLFESKVVACLKQHRCHWCNEPILRGTPARYEKGLDDGSFYGIYYHLECYTAMVKSDFDECLPQSQQRGVPIL